MTQYMAQVKQYVDSQEVIDASIKIEAGHVLRDRHDSIAKTLPAPLPIALPLSSMPRRAGAGGSSSSSSSSSSDALSLASDNSVRPANGKRKALASALATTNSFSSSSSSSSLSPSSSAAAASGATHQRRSSHSSLTHKHQRTASAASGSSATPRIRKPGGNRSESKGKEETLESDGLQSSEDEEEEEEEEDEDEEESGNEHGGGNGTTKEFAKVGDLTDALYDLFTNVRTRPGSNQDHMRHVGQLVVLGQSSVARKRIESWIAMDVRSLFGICSMPIQCLDLVRFSILSSTSFLCRFSWHGQECMLQELIDVKGATVGVASRAAAAMTGLPFDESHKACLAMKKLKVKLKFDELRSKVEELAQRLLARATQM